ncbi:MAG: insulinase family protein [Deltaproteobacteria bacterium]|nr:insulinase family protein [Deltaproteobacteria bacterium]
MSDLPFQRERLDCGLTVLLRELHVAPVAEVQIWAGVGSADERPGELGLAHFYEHMLFKGTSRRGVGEVAGDVEGAGGRINAYTSHDVTVYHATLPSRALATGIDVLSDMVRFPAFAPEEIAREIEVVLEEIRRGNDSPSSVLADAIFAEAYRVHPYRSPILGPPESVAAFERGRVLDFFRRWYGPDNLTVVLAGDLRADEALAWVRAAFADAKPSGARRARAAEPRQRGLRAALLRRSFERASLELVWPAVGFGHPDAPLLDLLGYVLGGGESSRLVQQVKEHAGLADRIDASAYTPLDAGLFAVSLETSAENAEAALEAVARDVERVRRAVVATDELERARVNFLASEHFERESVSGIARKTGSFALLAGDPLGDARYLGAIRRATPADLLRVAQQYLAPDELTVGAVLPEAAPVRFDRGSVEGAITRGFESAARSFARPSRLPAIADGIVSHHLACGARLYVAPRHDVPVVSLRAAGLGGLLCENEGSAGITSFLASMWLRGTELRSALDLARSIESLAADIDGFSGRSSLGLTLDCTSEQLTPALDLFAEVLLRPGFDEEEIERERRETLAALARREDRLGEKVFDLFLGALYPSHPYRLPLRGLPEAVQGFDAANLAAHHTRLVQAENLVIGVAGDVDADEIAARLSSLLAELAGGDFVTPSPPADPPLREAARVEIRKAREQAHLVIGFRGLTVRDDDRFALEVISQILAGQGGRLFLELRDRKGLAYAVNAANVEAFAPGFFAVYIGTAPEKLEEAERSMRTELERLLDAPPAEDELLRAKSHLAGSFEIDLQRSSVRAAHLSLDALYGLGADADRFYVERVLSVGAEDVLRVARRVIDLAAPVVAVVRP